MWMNGSSRQSDRPASRTRTRRLGSALSRFARTHPADPPPTMTTSHRAVRSAAIGGDASAPSRLGPSWRVRWPDRPRGWRAPMLLLRRGPRTVYRHPVNAELYNSPPIGARVADMVTSFLG